MDALTKNPIKRFFILRVHRRDETTEGGIIVEDYCRKSLSAARKKAKLLIRLNKDEITLLEIGMIDIDLCGLSKRDIFLAGMNAQREGVLNGYALNNRIIPVEEWSKGARAYHNE